jgi:uncharacterized membrane protein (DUF373 family)
MATEERDRTGDRTPMDMAVRWIIKADMLLHLIVALVLIASCFIIAWFAFEDILPLSRASVIHVINDMLLILIILELLWTVIRFLKKKKFVLGPFFSIGIIAALRRILLIEAQTSTLDHVEMEKLYEIALSAGVVLVLIIGYYIAYKAGSAE